MRQNQRMQQDAEGFAHIRLNTEPRSSSTLYNNRTGSSDRRCNKWFTISIYIILAITGQSIARLLENFYYLHKVNKHRKNNGIWTQSLLQFIGFPILIFPFLFLCFIKQNRRLPYTFIQRSNKYLAIFYFALGIMMAIQAASSSQSKFELPFSVFTPVYATQILFTVLTSVVYKKIKFCRWTVISLVFAILAGALTFSSSFAGGPNKHERKYDSGIAYAFTACVFFSGLLVEVHNLFDDVIPDRDDPTYRKLGVFVLRLKMLIFSSFVATVVTVPFVFISGEHQDLKRVMDGFSKGKAAYVKTMVGQAVAWQIYWVGIVGLVCVVSSVFSNVISVCTWPLVSVLVLLFHYGDNQYDVFNGITIGFAALSVASYIYMIHKQDSDGDEATS
ncbi:PREDICTED: putative purine permease 15 [Camelina sativa]|uniref:Probable purine permease n=1 Tax=Camelina sativa TaxID=90675 RepID=A0ABM0TMK7_CAMSA|nr:PREDICTED: putative purine permease 15 [Camelina sativa]